MPRNKLLRILDASEPMKENFEGTKPSFKSKNKFIRCIIRENYGADKMIRYFDFTFDLEKDHYDT